MIERNALAEAGYDDYRLRLIFEGYGVEEWRTLPEHYRQALASFAARVREETLDWSRSFGGKKCRQFMGYPEVW